MTAPNPPVPPAEPEERRGDESSPEPATGAPPPVPPSAPGASVPAAPASGPPPPPGQGFGYWPPPGQVPGYGAGRPPAYRPGQPPAYSPGQASAYDTPQGQPPGYPPPAQVPGYAPPSAQVPGYGPPPGQGPGYAPPPGQPPGYPPPGQGPGYGPAPVPSSGPPPRRRSVWPIVLIVSAVFLVLAVVGTVFVVGLDQATTHELVQADFQTAATPFHVGTKTDVEYALADGAYAIRQRTDNMSVGVSVGEFSRVAYVADASADVTVLANRPAPVAVGLGCYGPGQDPVGYVLTAKPDGSAAAILRSDKPKGAPALASTDIAADKASPVAHLRLVCAVDSPAGSAMTLTGYVNGVQVVTAHDDKGIESYSFTALVMIADQTGAEARFDNVVTTVPE